MQLSVHHCNKTFASNYQTIAWFWKQYPSVFLSSALLGSAAAFPTCSVHQWYKSCLQFFDVLAAALVAIEICPTEVVLLCQQLMGGSQRFFHDPQQTNSKFKTLHILRCEAFFFLHHQIILHFPMLCLVHDQFLYYAVWFFFCLKNSSSPCSFTFKRLWMHSSISLSSKEVGIPTVGLLCQGSTKLYTQLLLILWQPSQFLPSLFFPSRAAKAEWNSLSSWRMDKPSSTQ